MRRAVSRRMIAQAAEAAIPCKSAAAAAAANVPKMPPFDHRPLPYEGPAAAEILRKRAEFLSPSLFHFYKNPLNIVEGKMQYLYDENGRRYLDAFAGIATVCCGHCHPEVIEAITDQTKRLQHSTVVYLNHVIADFAEALASKMPGNLKVVFFTNSGTEANELAMMIARLYTGCHDVISLRNSYHGNAAGTMGATAQSNWKFNIIQSGVHHAQNPDPYRGVFGSDGEKYARDVEEIIDFGTSGHVAGFISEAIQGVGGIVELAPGYLPAVYKSIRKAGGLCIADEVQSGFARPGSHFWGSRLTAWSPTLLRWQRALEMESPSEPSSRLAKSRTARERKAPGERVCRRNYLKNRLKHLQEKHSIIGDVRGRGLMLGVELVTDRELKTPAKTEILHVMEQMKEMGVLVGKGGYYGNVFRITPPLCFTKEDSDFFVDVMDTALAKL
uniref:Uncharacterized protein n=1 Tax=Ananas comosus var. bracteatus TaxID=296719 RepID=A0A6V7QA08_ANACO|nr:unnamed protein product [Ananas comosus var. bracteatus]